MYINAGMTSTPIFNSEATDNSLILTPYFDQDKKDTVYFQFKRNHTINWQLLNPRQAIFSSLRTCNCPVWPRQFVCSEVSSLPCNRCRTMRPPASPSPDTPGGKKLGKSRSTATCLLHLYRCTHVCVCVRCGEWVCKERRIVWLGDAL